MSTDEIVRLHELLAKLQDVKRTTQSLKELFDA